MKKTDRKKKKAKNRSAEIFSVFAKHNFYVNGFTPEELRTTLEDLGPTYVKIGQIMSSRVDLLPDVQPPDAAVHEADARTVCGG